MEVSVFDTMFLSLPHIVLPLLAASAASAFIAFIFGILFFVRK